MYGLTNLAYLVATPIEMVVLVVLICGQVGVAAGLAGLVPLAVFVPFNMYMMNASEAHQVREQGGAAGGLSRHRSL
jgi:hypothetical protein